MTARFIRIPKKNEQVRLKSEQVVYLAEGNAEAWYLEKLLDAHGSKVAKVGTAGRAR